MKKGKKKKEIKKKRKKERKKPNQDRRKEKQVMVCYLCSRCEMDIVTQIVGASAKGDLGRYFGIQSFIFSQIRGLRHCLVFPLE